MLVYCRFATLYLAKVAKVEDFMALILNFVDCLVDLVLVKFKTLSHEL